MLVRTALRRTGRTSAGETTGRRALSLPPGRRAFSRSTLLSKFVRR